MANALVVNSCDTVVVMAAQTTFRYVDVDAATSRDLENALQRPVEELWMCHHNDYRSLYRRMSLHLWPDAVHLPTDGRLLNMRDPGLLALYYNYSRYLLISCSRDGYKSLGT